MTVINWFKNFQRAKAIAAWDKFLFIQNKQPYQIKSRPVIRWIKGDGLDDDVTRAAICQATRLFGDEVDYCLLTQGIKPERAREILSWAEQSVEWIPITENDNPKLAKFLISADCAPENFGYWWKWFPERIRINAPEWILDGDMVIVGRPEWFSNWKAGADPIRVSENLEEQLYGEYAKHINSSSRLYSGLISLPPYIRYMNPVAALLKTQPLAKSHNGRTNPSEQGVIASAFQKLNAVPIPLHEFPFAHPTLDELQFGASKERNSIWGYHFVGTFLSHNPWFDKLTAKGVIVSKSKQSIAEKYRWLSGGRGQWGTPGWGMHENLIDVVIENTIDMAGGLALEIGTSRGRIAAVLEDIGFQVTTVDHVDRGAAKNLKGLNVKVVVESATNFLSLTKDKYNIIFIDLHENSTKTWRKIWQFLPDKLLEHGKIIINNLNLSDIEEWKNESGVKDLVDNLSNDWNVKILTEYLPGVVLLELK